MYVPIAEKDKIKSGCSYFILSAKWFDKLSKI